MMSAATTAKYALPPQQPPGTPSTCRLALFRPQVLNQTEARFNSAELNIHYKMSVPEYQKLCDYSDALEENWGKPPGNLNSNGQELLIYGKQFGNVFIGVQPTLTAIFRSETLP